MDATYLEDENARFFIDTGAHVNLIKITALLPNNYIDASERAFITKVSLTRVYTLGFTEIEIFGKRVSFHVVRHTFPISFEGILDRPDLRLECSNISFFYNVLITQSRPVDLISFIDPEATKDNLELLPEVKPVPRILTVRARTGKSVTIPIAESEIKEDYLPLIKTKPEGFVAEAAVLTKGGEF